MASTMRSIDTRFWTDVWVRSLNALDRYAFLYFLTNEHSTWCGVYELDFSMIAFETGIDEHDLKKSIMPKLSPKILYVDGWIYIKNFEKYHANKSPQTQKGIEEAWKKVPERIKAKISQIKSKKIPPRGGMVGGSPSAFASASASSSNTTPQDGVGKEVNEFIGLFKNINPSYQKLFGMKSQRDAIERMLKEHGREKVKWALGVLPQTNLKKYMPTITTPIQLEDKLASLIFSLKKESNKGLQML